MIAIDGTWRRPARCEMRLTPARNFPTDLLDSSSAFDVPAEHEGNIMQQSASIIAELEEAVRSGFHSCLALIAPMEIMSG